MNTNEEKKIVQYCGLKLGNGHYAIPVLDIQEVLRPQNITDVPLSKDYIKGLINLRGQIVTSVDLKKVFSLSTSDEKKDKAQAEPYMNIIVKGDDGLVAIMVDEILDIVEVNFDEVEKTPETISEKIKKYVDGVFKQENNLLVLINTKNILNFE